MTALAYFAGKHSAITPFGRKPREWIAARAAHSPRIHQMDWAGRTEDRGNAGETAGSFFHPSGRSEFGYLTQREGLIYQSKLARGAGRAPFHPVNPGSHSDLHPCWQARHRSGGSF